MQAPTVAVVTYAKPAGASVDPAAPTEVFVLNIGSEPEPEPLGEVKTVGITQLQDDIRDVLNRRLPDHEDAVGMFSPHLWRALMIARHEGIA
jgi:hypothetical protein